MKKIKLGRYKHKSKHNGMFALVDDNDFDALNEHYWCAAELRKGLFYAVRTTKRDSNRKQKTIRMHNDIMGETWIDHIDGNGLNNQKSNLRLSCPKTNSQNRKQRTNKESIYTGVYKNSETTYRARIKIDGKFLYLGSSEDPKECAKMYNDAVDKYRDKYAFRNKID